MGKKVLGIGLAIVGIALIATGIGAPLGTIALGAGLGTLSVATVVGMGLLVASSVLMGPAMPKMPGSLADGGRDRLFANLDPTTPRKFVFGITAMATDVRYQTFTGKDQEYLEQILCCASHEVQSIDEIWLDNEKAWTLAGGVQGRFVDYLTVATRTLGTSANGIAINAVWTVNSTLTGCAYVHLKAKLSANSEKSESPFGGGLTNRITIRGKGAKVYDPRLDSTVAGGSGAHRANDQATWAWDDNASRNPALQELWYELGWKIGTKLAVGKGIPLARLDLASYAVAANVCDESVTKADLSTEPRYCSDGVMSEGDDPSAVREALCATMNAVLRDAGGKLALTVLTNDLGAPVASFDEDDVLGGIDWRQTPELHGIFNIVRGRRIDPSDTSLYQPVDFPEVVLTSPDGIDRIDTIDYPLVHSNGQAQRLAKQRLQRNQYQGRLALTGKPSWWQLSLGEVFELSHSSFGWTDKLFRCAGIKISRTGETEIIAVEENAAIYAWDKEELAAVTPGAPTIYNPMNDPVQSGIRDARTAIGNELHDTQFRAWETTAGAIRKVADAADGYALGKQPYFMELAPNTSTEVSATSPNVGVEPGLRYFFSVKAQRGTSLGSGSRLNFGGQWIGDDGTTVVGSFTEGEQQTPSSLTAGELPKEITWTGVAPLTAYYVRLKVYTPALASSSGTFRVEDPNVLRHEVSADVTLTASGPTSASFLHSYAGVAESGEYPRDLTPYKLTGPAGQIMAGITWEYRVLTGTVNTFTSASGWKAMSGAGSGTLTVNSMGTNEATVETRATYNGSNRTAPPTQLVKTFAAPPTGGGGGSELLLTKTSGYNDFSTTTFTDVTGTQAFTMPTGKTTARLTFNGEALGAGPSSWSHTVEMKFEREIAAVWTAQGTLQSDVTERVQDAEGNWEIYPAVFAYTFDITGLTAGASYNSRISMRLTSGTRTCSVTGTFSVEAV